MVWTYTRLGIWTMRFTMLYQMLLCRKFILIFPFSYYVYVGHSGGQYYFVFAPFRVKELNTFLWFLLLLGLSILFGDNTDWYLFVSEVFSVCIILFCFLVLGLSYFLFEKHIDISLLNVIIMSTHTDILCYSMYEK